MTDETNTQPKITASIRSYSIRAEKEYPESALSKGLSRAVRFAPNLEDWERWLQGMDLPRILEEQRKEIVNMWQRLDSFLARRSNLIYTHNGVPTIDTLYSAVQIAEQKWKERNEKCKAKDRFFDFLETMDDYSYLFKVIPADDKYISLFTGVLSSIVKASVNHSHIADGFSLALVEMSSNLRIAKRKREIGDGPEMRRLVAELCVQIFKLLCHAMRYFMSRIHRITSALNRNFYNKIVRTLVDGIQATTQKILREAGHASQLRIYDINRTLGSLQVTGNGNRNDNDKRIHDKLNQMALDLGRHTIRHLNAVEEHHTHDQLSVLRNQTILSSQDGPDEIGSAHGGDLESAAVDVELSDASGETELCTRYEIRKYACALLHYVEDGREVIYSALGGSSRGLLPDEVLIELQEWLGAKESKMIWVEGMPADSYGSELSLAAMRLVDISLNAGVPCISFFVKPSYNFASKTLPQRQAAVVALLYSIITQLASLLPVEFEGMDELDETQFRKLDGSFSSVPIALRIIQALLAHAPPSLIWVLDGVEMAENSDTIHDLKKFVEILQDQEKRHISKVCFTSDGNSIVLTGAMSIFERVDASRMAQGRPGHLLKGGADINTLF
ncbi:hypothetical protein F5Y04DRAFT_292774 [Hypomontagnella monticulosa]|nr:hypothetical protein F5Y04DRAFT_292774 [Hypomontagnella monticulosa]